MKTNVYTHTQTLLLKMQKLYTPYILLYRGYNHENMCIKSEVEEILFKLATNDHSDEDFLLT